MKKYGFLVSVLLVMILPHVLFTVFEVRNESTQSPEITVPEQEATEYMISVSDGTSVRSIELDDYITGVVLGEMPAEFELEALKAQAVATRTYTLRNVMRKSKHLEADVCTDPACCQGFADAAAYAGGEENLQKVRQAVAQTSGQVSLIREI